MTAKYGPHTAAVEAFLALLPGLTHVEWGQVAVAWCSEQHSDRVDADDAAWRSTRDLDLVDAWWAIRDAAWDALWAARARSHGPRPEHQPDPIHALWGAVWAAARDAAWDATRALVVRDLISPEHYTILTAPFAGIARFAAVLAHPGKDTP